MTDKVPNCDIDMSPAAQETAPQWQVYFSGGFWSRTPYERAGTALTLGRQFDVLGRNWFVPAVYLCGKGIVLDLCMRVAPEEIHSFMDKWQLSPENDSCNRFTREEQMLLDAENPLSPDIKPRLCLNGKPLRLSHSCSVCINPCLPEKYGDAVAKQVAAHYALDTRDGWVISRSSFLWAGKRRPMIKSLSLTLAEKSRPVFSAPFTLRAAGDTATFESPLSGEAYTLCVKEFTRQTVPQYAFPSTQIRGPLRFILMRYTLSPDGGENIRICDCNKNDRYTDPAACVGIIGGADGPTVLFLSETAAQENGVYTACSSSYFEPLSDGVTWRAIFRDDDTVSAPVSLL